MSNGSKIVCSIRIFSISAVEQRQFRRESLLRLIRRVPTRFVTTVHVMLAVSENVRRRAEHILNNFVPGNIAIKCSTGVTRRRQSHTPVDLSFPLKILVSRF